MASIQVLLSSYNGEKYIVEQLESILRQENVEVHCLIRDDGSTDGTLEILNKYKETHSTIEVIQGENIGWQKSFVELVFKSGEYDYYAFADQDDVWLPMKLYKGIEKIKKYSNISIMYCSSVKYVDENLRPLNHVNQKKLPLRKETVLVNGYAQGCTVIFNQKAKKLFKLYRPNNINFHDIWFSTLIVYFGKMVYDEKSYILYRRHTNSVTTHKEYFGKVIEYMNLIFKDEKKFRNHEELLKGYKDMIYEEDIKTINQITNYRKSIKDKMALVCNKSIRYTSIRGTFFMKVLILLSRF